MLMSGVFRQLGKYLSDRDKPIGFICREALFDRLKPMAGKASHGSGPINMLPGGLSDSWFTGGLGPHQIEIRSRVNQSCNGAITAGFVSCLMPT
jgi:hypothetical protein